MKNSKKIYILGNIAKYGGPLTFRNKFEYFLKSNNVLTSTLDIFRIKRKERPLILIVNGTRRIFTQLLLRILGYKIALRVDGVIKYEFSHVDSFKSLIMAYMRFIIITINAILSQKIIYQSAHIKNTHFYSTTLRFIFSRKESKIIYNPSVLATKTVKKGNKILCVEGQTGNNYSNYLLKHISKYVDIVVIGNVDRRIRSKSIRYLGRMPHKDVLQVFSESWLAMFVLEAFPPCPNSVLEAIGYGIPVIGIDNGSLNEILKDSHLLLKSNIAWGDDINDLKIEGEDLLELLNYVRLNWSLVSKDMLNRSKKFNENDIFLEYVDFIS